MRPRKYEVVLSGWTSTQFAFNESQAITLA